MGEPRRAGWTEFAAEPFRLFFPAAVLFGALGALLWPAHLFGFLAWYPGVAHSRLLILGFFGGFIAGFLGASLPRLLGAPPARVSQIILLLTLHLAANAAYLTGNIAQGDSLALALWFAFATWAATRLLQRKDTPPPGFILAALGVACLLAGLILNLLPADDEIPSAARAAWPRLLAHQGFVLLPILGVGAFLFPRVFKTPNPQEFPEALSPEPTWWRRFTLALAIGVGVILTFWLEAAGWARGGPAARAALILLYAALELPRRRGPGPWLEPWLLRVALGFIILGFSLAAIAPGWRVGWLHLVLMGGFATTVLVLGTRVVCGHGGRPPNPARQARWLKVCVGLALLAMLTRVSGDLWPKIMRTHYIYGALLWTAALTLWSWKILPEILWHAPED